MDGEKNAPLLRVGITGDIQGYPFAYDWGMHNLEKAFRLLAPKKPDVLIMDGDLSDCGDSAAFPYYQAMVERFFPDKRPVPAVCAGNHDYGRDNPSAHADLCRAVGQSPVNPGHIVVNGYDFIMVSDRVTGRDGSQHYTEEVLARLEEELKTAVARDPEKPVFVITHFPPSGTMAGSHGAEGSEDLRRLFNRYPSVFSISGHTHYPLEDERSIWQGEFTAIQTSSLSYACMEERPFNSCNAIIPFAREAVQCLYMEVFADRLEIHRYNVEEQREIKPDRIWRVPVPFDRASAPYAESRVRAGRKAPEFEAGTQAYLRYDYGYLYLIFEGAKHEDPVPFYRLVLRDVSGSGEAVFRSENLYVSNFCRLERNRDPRQVIQLPGKDLTPHGTIRAEIYPRDSFGLEGQPLITEFRNPCGNPKPGITDRPQE